MNLTLLALDGQGIGVAPVVRTAALPPEPPPGAAPGRPRAWEDWGPWSRCSRSCTARRYRACSAAELCGREVLKEQAFCYVDGGYCHGWLKKRATLQQRGKTDCAV